MSGQTDNKRPILKAIKVVLVFGAGLVFAIICFLLINTVSKSFSSSNYCGSNCHEMNTAYQSWELSSHYANDHGVVAECVDCHLPPKEKYFAHLIKKAYKGAKDIYTHHFGGEYDIKKMQKEILEQMPDNRCLQCHGSLLVKPSSSAARKAHLAASYPGEDVKSRCVDCHDKLHERERKIFKPD